MLDGFLQHIATLDMRTANGRKIVKSDFLVSVLVRNAHLIFDRLNGEITLRLVEPALHGDCKDVSRELVPVGKYCVDDIWENCYGKWVRILYNGKKHDIEPRFFEWYQEDQHLTTASTRLAGTLAS